MSNPIVTYTLNGSNSSVSFDPTKFTTFEPMWEQDVVESINPITRAYQTVLRGVRLRVVITFQKMHRDDLWQYLPLLQNGISSCVFYPAGIDGVGFNVFVKSNLQYKETYPEIIEGPVTFTLMGKDLLVGPVQY
jgi:hypothetical protein